MSKRNPFKTPQKGSAIPVFLKEVRPSSNYFIDPNVAKNVIPNVNYKI